MTYAGLGYRPAIATADTSGFNAGNWTVTFAPEAVGANVPYFEVYHYYVHAPLVPTTGTNVRIMLNQGAWDYNLIGQANGWDPSQPMIMTPGDTLYFLFNVPTSTSPAPQVTCWFRYDIQYTGGTPIAVV